MANPDTTLSTALHHGDPVVVQAAHGANVPVNFGAPHGLPITNKSTLFKQIDDALGVPKPPDVEYLFFEPFAALQLGPLGVAKNYYGHAAVRYTMPSGEQKVMNIVGLPNGEMVNFVEPAEYMFGTSEMSHKAQQGGIYNRAVVGVRVENLPKDTIEDLDHYYRRLSRRDRQKEAKFSLLFSPIYNLLSEVLPVSIAERGNCARWTSMGLVEAGIIKRPTIWPKKIFIHLFEQQGSKNPSNVNVVSYRKVPHAAHVYGAEPGTMSGVQPLHPIENMLYYNLERFAKVVVEVPPDSTSATITIKQPDPPSWTRYHRHYFYAAGGALFTAAALLFGRAKLSPAVVQAAAAKPLQKLNIPTFKNTNNSNITKK